MSEAVDAAFIGGIGIMAYTQGGPFAAGMAVTIASFLIAFLAAVVEG